MRTRNFSTSRRKVDSFCTIIPFLCTIFNLSMYPTHRRLIDNKKPAVLINFKIGFHFFLIFFSWPLSFHFEIL